MKKLSDPIETVVSDSVGGIVESFRPGGKTEMSGWAKTALIVLGVVFLLAAGIVAFA